MITKVTLRKRTVKGRELTQLEYEGTRKDSMGDWISSGTLADVIEVDGHIVCVNPLNQKPFLVCHSMAELALKIKEAYNVKMEQDGNIQHPEGTA